MKTIFYFVIIFSLISCGSNTINRLKEPIAMRIKKNNFILYSGDSTTKFTRWQNVKVIGYISSFFTEDKYLITFNDKEYLIEKSATGSDCELIADSLGSKIEVPKEKISMYWSRTIQAINHYTDLKIQTQTDYIIETYNPFENEQVGFSVSKEETEKGFKITVHCIYKYQPSAYKKPSEMDKLLEQKVIYYILKGEYCI